MFRALKHPQLRGRQSLQGTREQVTFFLEYILNFRKYKSAALPRWAAREVLREGRKVAKHGAWCGTTAHMTHRQTDGAYRSTLAPPLPKSSAPILPG